MSEHPISGGPNVRRIGDIGNLYGDLYVRDIDGRTEWAVECVVNGCKWRPITRSLYDALIEYERSGSGEPST